MSYLFVPEVKGQMWTDVPGITDGEFFEEVCLVPTVIVQVVVELEGTQTNSIVHCKMWRGKGGWGEEREEGGRGRE